MWQPKGEKEFPPALADPCFDVEGTLKVCCNHNAMRFFHLFRGVLITRRTRSHLPWLTASLLMPIGHRVWVMLEAINVAVVPLPRIHGGTHWDGLRWIDRVDAGGCEVAVVRGELAVAGRR